MRCPYGSEVGDPPTRSKCSRDDKCLCDIDVDITIQTQARDIDPQSMFVLKWWTKAHYEARAATIATHLAERPVLDLGD